MNLYKNNWYKILNLKNLNLFFIICISCLLFSHVIFSRGLDEDGVFRMAEMLLFNRFPYSEISRLFFHRIYHIPFYLITNFTDIKSLPFLTAFYSFSIISIHIPALFFCYLILPQDKKEMIFFPLFAFLVSQAVSLGISISISISVCSYIWFIVFLIHYSNLNKKSHKLLFILAPIPLLLSHELMIYISLFYIFLSLLKHKHEKSLINKIIIKLIIIFFIVVFIFQNTIINTSINYNQFKITFFNLAFLIDEDFINISVLCSLLLIVSLYLFFFKTNFNTRKQIQFFNKLQILLLYIFVIISFILIGAIIFNLQNYFVPYSDYYARVYTPTIPLFLMLFIWCFFKDKNIKYLFNNTPSFFYFIGSCILYCSLLLFSRFYSDWQFYNHQKHFTKRIESCKGIVSLDEFKNISSNENFNTEKIKIWVIQASALIYPRSNLIEAEINFPKKQFIETCTLGLEKNYNYCDLIYKYHDLFSKSNTEKFISRNKFFNFTPLLKSIENNVSYCN